jgi:preprotein translocase subunit SecF
MTELAAHGFHFDFLGKRHLFVALSAILSVASVALWIQKGDSKYGTDFRGGSEYIIRFHDVDVDVQKLRGALDKQKIETTRVQEFQGAFEGKHDYSVQVGGGGDPKVVQAAFKDALKAGFGDKAEIIRTDYVGPTVGRELQQQALIATALSLIAVLIYISWRFEFAFALGAVVALFHDVTLAMGIYLVLGKQVNMGTLAAVLTIVGYSVNDTIIIFDRVREEIFKAKEDTELVPLMNRCINLMLSRTIITTGLTLISVAGLLIFGGGAISELSLYLFVGMICGCYSTIYIASPIVIAWDGYRMRRAKRRATRATQAPA